MVLVVALRGPAGATDVDTADGRHFSNCHVLKADGLGIYFRHDHGMARILYEDLSEELLAALEPLPMTENGAAVGLEATGGKKVPSNREESAASAESRSSSGVGALQLQFWQRVTYGVPAELTQARPCGQVSRGRFVGAHRYSRFPCRQLAGTGLSHYCGRSAQAGRSGDATNSASGALSLLLLIPILKRFRSSGSDWGFRAEGRSFFRPNPVERPLHGGAGERSRVPVAACRGNRGA